MGEVPGIVEYRQGLSAIKIHLRMHGRIAEAVLDEVEINGRLGQPLFRAAIAINIVRSFECFG